MPSLPKWLADGLEKTFASMLHPVTVSQVEAVDQNLRRVTFAGNLSGCRYQPGNVIEFRVSERDMRHYTPSRFEPESGQCEVLFFLHGPAVGTEWVKSLQPGQEFKLMGPGGHLAYQPEARRHLIFGDESALGLACALARASAQAGQQVSCLFELEAAHAHWPELLGLPATVVAKSSAEPAAASLAALETLLAEPADTAFYLSGRAQSIQRVLRLLKQKGVSRRQIQTEPYWADGKKGL